MLFKKLQTKEKTTLIKALYKEYLEISIELQKKELPAHSSQGVLFMLFNFIVLL